MKKHGVKALILDADNTLRLYRKPEPADGIAAWIGKLKDNGIALIILSNNYPSRVKPFAQKLGLDFIAMGLKPSPIGILRAKRRLGITKKQVAIVGDQIFTDIIGGNLLGITTILVKPLKLENGATYRFKRWLEQPIIKRHKNKSKPILNSK
ncbi:MAG: YqeG family HAD IIIA-type phosphatase [Oscillospiraceae bacterium]|nr:YqeG family HAD IIIA-type phosphatase [Oscillospiraceae bacterium]